MRRRKSGRRMGRRIRGIWTPPEKASSARAAVVGVALYAAAFLWLGLVSSYAIGAGLLYIVLWEGFLSGFVSGVRLLSIRHYSIAVMHALDPRRFAAGPHVAPSAAVLISALVFAGFIMLTVRRLRRMDVP